METQISLDEAERNFSALMKRVVDGKETVLLTAEGTVVGRIVPENVPEAVTKEPEPREPAQVGMPAKKFLELWEKRPRLTPEEADQFAKDIEEFRQIWNKPRIPEDPWEKWG